MADENLGLRLTSELLGGTKRKGLWDWALSSWDLMLSQGRVEKAMAPHSSTLAWKIPWMEEPGRLQCMGSQRFRQDWATSLSLFTFMHWKRKWQPTPVFLPGVPGMGEPGGLQSTGSHRVGQDWSNLVAAAAAESTRLLEMLGNKEFKHMKWRYKWHASC